MAKPLEGRAALITGASRGLGLAIARQFVLAGADVFLCARHADTLEEARRSVAALAPDRRVLAAAADVSQPADVTRVSEAALAAFPALQVLVNNAGVYGPLGSIERVDWSAWLRAIEINVFGSVLMARALVPHFKTRNRGKIIQISGAGATKPLPNISAYAASKAAIVRFAETLAEELRPHHVDVNAVAPGALNTGMLDEVIHAGPVAVGDAFYERALQQKSDGGTPLSRGAELCVFLASAASDGITGKLIAAVWDPWSTLPQHRADLEGTDVYTIRRILPEDRGLTFASNPEPGA
jgi:NAD(P)-dependent dehydrogenase (short-subunit alcohol dehydrogenase family)